MDLEEVEEVRSLLSRHKTQIINDLLETQLIAILKKNSVLSSSQELELITKNDENCDNIIEKNNLCDKIDVKCNKLIEFISKNGFVKFKQFCYAIESECPQLIEDLINDRLKCDSKPSNRPKSAEEDKKTEDNKLEADTEFTRENLNLAQSRRSISSRETTNTLPIAAPRRKTLSTLTPPPQKQEIKNSSPYLYRQRSTPPTLRKSLPPIDNKDRTEITSQYCQTNPYSSLFCYSSAKNSPLPVRKREKLLHRFSDAATLGRRFRKKKSNTERGCYSAIEILADPVIEDDFFGDMTTWEYHTVAVTRVPGYGFGIAVSGGRDNPHFANGDPSIAVSDVLKDGPAEERLQVNDRIISVNGVSLENVEYATAVQVLRDSGNTVTLVVKRRVSTINTNSMHQHTHSMSSTGLSGNSTVNTLINNTGSRIIPVSPPASGQSMKVILTKASKKEDFGIVLGCRLFVKEISAKARDQLALNGYSLQEGDIITRIHNTNCNDSMSIKEAKKIIEGCKERLGLVILKEATNNLTSNNNNSNLNNSGLQSQIYSHTHQLSGCSNNLDDSYIGSTSYSSQNLYVQPPTRNSNAVSPNDEKTNVIPRGRSRNPLVDVSLSQLDRPSTPQNNTTTTTTARKSLNPDEPPRPPPPRVENYYSSRQQLFDEDPLQRQRQSAEPRFISFQKEGSVGIRLTGGNEAGIYVTAVQPGSPASLQGLTPGDKILKVNDMDMRGVTREEAVLFLLSLQDRIDLIVQHCKVEYEEVVANQRGDSFHIKTHFHCDNASKGEMAFKAGDVFRVIDTLHNGVVGSWQVLKIGRGHQEIQRGVIPNKSRAEELATAQFNATKKEMNASESRGNFFRRRRTHQRSKSLSRENWDDVVFSDSISKFPAYERVVLRHPGFVRPVILFGPVADLAREKLTKDFPDKYTAPLQDDDKTNAQCGIVRLSNIRDIMDRGKHALLDITPNAVDRLNYAQFYPIVIFLKTDTKHVIKQLRHGLPKTAHKSSKKLLDQCQKLEKIWSHIFCTTILLTDADSWYRKLREAIDLQQSGAVWMSKSKPVESLSDDFLFPMTTSRLSYASSPESDLELSPGPSASLSLGNLPQLIKSNSDPSIATNQDNLDRDRDIGEGLPPPYTNPYDLSPPNHNHHQSIESKYGYTTSNPNQSKMTENNSSIKSQSIYGINAPDLPPRVDRASKPSGGIQIPSVITGKNQQRNGNSIGRSAQERLFSKTLTPENGQDEYAGITDSIERKQNSLDRQLSINSANNNLVQGCALKNGTRITQNDSYDSVSSYDSYSTAQLSAQSIRLGPNAPDDLKSVPNANGRQQLPTTLISNTNDYRNNPDINKISHHDHSRSIHDNTRGLNTANDLSRQNSPGRPTYLDVNQTRNIDSRLQHDIRSHQPGIGLSQRPSNVGLENSPRKPLLETKTDYGKYSRNNSATQADCNKSPKSPHIPPPTLNGTHSSGVPFKPVPPPKPKNYRPPVQNQMAGHLWENGESKSAISPNGFFYPPTPSHYHHSQVISGSSHNDNNGGPQQSVHGYGHYNSGQHPPYHPPNGHNGNNHQYVGQYVHRGHPPLGNISQQSQERHALDLAGSREQRGSAFELYRKPQIGASGHHHVISDMEPYELFYNQQLPHNLHNSIMYANEMNERNYRHFYVDNSVPLTPPPPPRPLSKMIKKSMLRSPLAALKKVFIKSTRPLRRMNSMVEPERRIKPCLRRQHSLKESNISHNYFQEQFLPRPPPDNGYHYRHEPFQPQNMNNTYQNLQTDDIYDTTTKIITNSYNQDYDLYTNRALIDLERRQAESKINGRRIIRRHSMADRTNSRLNVLHSVSSRYDHDDIYQTHQGSYLVQHQQPSSAVMLRKRYYSDNPDEPVYQSRREMHRSHLYQSRKEMQERIAQGKREIEREFTPGMDIQLPTDRADKSEREQIHQIRRDTKDLANKARAKLREQIYQSRRGAMESMAEPIYVSKRDIMKHHPIYESREECTINLRDNETDEKKEQKSGNSTDGTITSKTSTDTEFSNETIIEHTIRSGQTPTCSKNLNHSPILTSSPLFNVSNIIKHATPPPSSIIALPKDLSSGIITSSQSSLETHYTSQASLPVEPPGATSTPYTSDISLQKNDINRIKEFPNTPREPSTTRGIFDEVGGTLCDNIWNVSLQIPKGAIPAGVKQEIYFTVSDPRMSETVGVPPLDMENGETMLSPLVMCGPQGLEFLVPVTLNIPHCAGRTPSLGLALKATDSEKNLQTNWDNIDLPTNVAAHTVSVKVDHF